MIQIYPKINQKFTCPKCEQEVKLNKIVWQGIHVGVESQCKICNRTFFQDLRVGHSMYFPYSVDLQNFELFGSELAKWNGSYLQTSLRHPNKKSIGFKKVMYKNNSKVIILNCIDFLYGHSLLKLLNAERHLKDDSKYGLIVIVPKFLEWMVPKGIAEKWVFDLSLKDGLEYFIEFNNIINEEIKRFSHVYLSQAYSHPKDVDITKFTGIEKHNFQKKDFRITFIWREERFWINNSFLEKINLKICIATFKNFLLYCQKRRVLKLFSTMRIHFPNAKFTVAGFGDYHKFPSWIDCHIKNSFNADIEKNLCTIYSDSRIVIGIHGSNMLLPSAHAGMTMDLMPSYKWGNFAQDIIYQEDDSRISSYRYRYIPLNINLYLLSKIISYMIFARDDFMQNMVNISSNINYETKALLFFENNDRNPFFLDIMKKLLKMFQRYG